MLNHSVVVIFLPVKIITRGFQNARIFIWFAFVFNVYMCCSLHLFSVFMYTLAFVALLLLLFAIRDNSCTEGS